MGHANCIGFECRGYQLSSAPFGTDFDLNFTGEMQAAISGGDFGAVWSFWGEEGPYKSYKPYYNLRADIVYDNPTPVATAVSPTDKQVTIDTQPTLVVNPVSDPNQFDGVKYYFQ